MRTAILLSLMLVLAGCLSTQPVQEAPEEPVLPPEEPGQATAPEAPQEVPEEIEETTPAEPPEEPAEPEEPLVPVTSKTSSELLDDALDEHISDFYRDHSGTYTENTYRWVVNLPVSDGSLMASPASQVRFDGEVISSIQAAGYIVFEKDGSENVFGAAVFNSQQTILDGMFAPFDVELFTGGDLEWCRVTQKEVYQWSSGGFVSVYKFECESIDKG